MIRTSENDLLRLVSLALGANAALVQEPASPKAIFQTAQQELIDPEYQRTESGFRDYLKMVPRFVAALSNLGVASDIIGIAEGHEGQLES